MARGTASVAAAGRLGVTGTSGATELHRRGTLWLAGLHGLPGCRPLAIAGTVAHAPHQQLQLALLLIRHS